MALKLEDLSTHSDSSSLRHKRGYCKSFVTIFWTHLETLKMKSLLDINLDNLFTKLKLVKETISSYEALQLRLEEVESPEKSQTHSKDIEVQRLSMESAKINLQRKIKHIHIAIDVEYLVNEVTDPMESISIACSTSQWKLLDFHQAYSEINHRANSQF